VITAVQLSELFAEGRYHELISAAQTAQITPQSDPIAARIMAAAFFFVGEFSAADTLLSELEPAFGLNSEFLSLYAANTRRLGQLQRAEQLFARALAITPKSLQVRNNYANLLIDLGRLEEARAILSALLVEAPDYQDARANLNRLSFQNSQPNESPTELSASSEPIHGLSLADPLLMAFSEEEVSQSVLLKRKKPNKTEASLIESLPDADGRAVALEQLEQANKSVLEKQFEFALTLCSQALRVLGAHAPIYDCASDAYLNLKRFHEAELCLLQAIALDSPTPKRCLNLVSFASMRGDIVLARYHLRQAASLDPSHPQLGQFRLNLDKLEAKTVQTPYAFEIAWDLPQVNQHSI